MEIDAKEKLSMMSLAPIRSGSTTTRILSNSKARHWLSDADTQWRLFPNRHVICDIGVVYRLMQENFDRILKRHLVVATEEVGANGVTVCCTLSFGCSFEIPIGFQCSVSVYSDRQRDVSDLQRHVSIHLANAALLQTKRPILLRVYFGWALEPDDVKESVSRLQLQASLKQDSWFIVFKTRYDARYVTSKL